MMYRQPLNSKINRLQKNMSSTLQSLIHFTKPSKTTEVLHGKSFSQHKTVIYLLLKIGQIKLVKIQTRLLEVYQKEELTET